MAYAVSYLVGTGFVVWFLSGLAPKLLKVNLKEEAKKLEATLSGGEEREEGVQSAYREWDVRAYELPAARSARPWGVREILRARQSLHQADTAQGDFLRR